ncbi:MAG TPA: tripartite tricarboxylate transporter substrate binding protein [Burkholderiales bacterium]|nr:tripartite tricarboxylate transporter substrate binding protein [Burkholderiales bacterium]
MRAKTWALCLVPMAVSVGMPAAAQQYPAKPVRIMVGYVPGGGVDTTARIMAAALTEHWGQQVLVENRPGAAGNIATEITAKATPDGHTLVLCNIGSHAITPARFRARLTYDPIRDFAFPAMIGGVPNVFMVHPSMPAKNLREFIAVAKAHPGKINFGSSGVGASPHLSIELFKTVAGIDIVHVPYKGAAAALADVMSGHMESSVGNLAGGPLAAIKASRVRALGVTSAKRNAQLAEVPTFAEQGVKGFDVTGWYGLCTQSKVPQATIAKINADVNQLLAGPALKKRLEDQGITLNPTTPEGFARHVAAEQEKWTKVVKDANLPGE